MSKLVLALVGTILLSACGGTSPQAQSTDTPAPSDSPAATAAPADQTDWKTVDDPQNCTDDGHQSISTAVIRGTLYLFVSCKDAVYVTEVTGL